jgi:hypothetical protein
LLSVCVSVYPPIVARKRLGKKIPLLLLGNCYVFFAVRVASKESRRLYFPERPPSQATAPNHPNAFTFTILLSEGQTGGAWEPSYKMMLFPLPTIKCLSLLPGLFTFIYSSTFYLSLSLSVSSQNSLLKDPFQYYPPIYAHISIVVSFLQLSCRLK